MFKTPLTLVAVFTLLLALSVVGLLRADAQLASAQASHRDSYLLADELRQSSDDLTRLARTYVATGEPKWEAQYLEVLDIRNGRRARPAEYHRIYWDLRAADIEPAGGVAPAVALIELMKQADFDAGELAKLKEAQDNSNDLVRTETLAMNLVKGLYPDQQGAFTVRGQPDPARALKLMHDADYHRYKANIMQPVNEFLAMLETRTSSRVAQAMTAATIWEYLIVLMTLLVAACTVWSLRQWWWINDRLGGTPDEVVGLVRELSAGDLSGTPTRAGLHEHSVLGGLFQMREQLSGIFSTVRMNAESVATASAEIASGTQDLSDRTEMQASSLQQTAATMDELGITVRNNADNAQQANELAKGASTIASQGGEVVSEVVQTMRGIDESSKKITDIITVIDGIAFQTNILALNAAVEAARAGEQGRGFAVVAGEVRSLARRSADAAKEIASLISDSEKRVSQGTELVNQAGQTMEEIVGSIRRVSDIVSEISLASQEQSSGVQQVGEAVMHMDQNTQQNAALVEESTAAAESLRQQADDLVQAVAVFRLPPGSTSARG
ncbi:MAG: methyl-accepting chemotaxis protein [Burkholderiaceae bacterium]